MTQRPHYLLLGGLAAILFATATKAPAQTVPNPNLWYRLTTLFRGANVAMDVINDGTNNNRMHMVPAGPYTGQYWKFTPFPGYPGRYRISCMWQGDNLPMDIINGGPDNNFPILAPIGPYSGQAWLLVDEPAAPGYVYLRTEFRGPGFSLEGFAGATQDLPQLLPSGPYSGMLWKLTPLLSVNPAAATPFGNACNGRGGPPSLGLSNLPWIGETMTGSCSAVPAGAVPLLVFGARLATPIDLAGANSPGCLLYVSPTLLIALTGATFGLPIPNSPSLVGQTLPMQCVIADPIGTPTVPTSNGLELRFGLR